MDTILAALIAAAVAVLGAIISFLTNRQILRTEIRKVETELARRLTEKLYDKRLETYPGAFEITDSLRADYLLKQRISKEYIEDVKNRLLEWHKKQGIVLSDETIRAYADLRRLLNQATQQDVKLSDNILRAIWQAKNEFRRSMRRDLNLLYSEERELSSKKN